MLRAHNGRMIFVSSVVGLSGSGGQANYAATKSGLVGFARSLAREFGSRGITANVVAPGFIETDLTAVLADSRRAELLDQIPLRRYGSPDEVAGVIVSWPATRLRTSPVPSYPSTADWEWGTEWVCSMALDCLVASACLITGVLTEASIAFDAARLAQQEGAKVVPVVLRPGIQAHRADRGPAARSAASDRTRRHERRRPDRLALTCR